MVKYLLLLRKRYIRDDSSLDCVKIINLYKYKEAKKIMKKKSRVEVLTTASHNAVSAVRTMIQLLKDTDEQIVIERAANDDKIAQIQSDNQSLDKLKEDNEKIISNFEALLN
jgi:hypothetical protein